MGLVVFLGICRIRFGEEWELLGFGIEYCDSRDRP
jgi:hypothetical protein